MPPPSRWTRASTCSGTWPRHSRRADRGTNGADRRFGPSLGCQDVRSGGLSMRMPRDLIGVLVLAGALILGTAGAPRSAVAAGTCKASYVLLGEFPRASGSTPTQWFNIFGEDFDSISAFTAATLSFSVPVIPWPTNETDPVQAAVTSYTVPMTAEQMRAGTKWSF